MYVHVIVFCVSLCVVGSRAFLTLPHTLVHVCVQSPMFFQSPTTLFS